MKKYLVVLLALVIAITNLSAQNLLKQVKNSVYVGSINIDYLKLQWEIPFTVSTDIIKHYGDKTNRPKHGADLNRYYECFLKPIAGDSVIKQIADGIRAVVQVAIQNNYSLWIDTINSPAELAVCLVQQLPYNHDEVGTGKALLDFPAFTLVRKSGTCLDKVILLIAILRELGYGSTMIYFPQADLNDGHAAVGIQSMPNDMRYFGDNYMYIEVSNTAMQTDMLSPFGNIGILPELKAGQLVGNLNPGIDLERNKKNYILLAGEKGEKTKFFLKTTSKKKYHSRY